MTQLACLLCGADTGEVTVRLVEWAEPIADRRYDTLPRCAAVEPCWARVVGVLREAWPVNDGRPAGASAVDEPLQAAEPTAADAPLPEPPWLTAPQEVAP